MTISASYSPDTYAGDDSTTSFAITFSFLSTASFVKVSLKTDSTGVITAQTGSGTDYSVSGSNVVFNTAPATGETVIIELNPDFTQDTDYAENAVFPAETLEADLDERTLEGQINNDLASRALTIDSSLSGVTTTIVASSTNSTNADKYLKFNSDGDGLELQTLSASAGLGSINEDTTPKLGGNLDLDGYYIGDGTNELITFTEDSLAVNQINIENEATGSGPIIQAAGDDTDIDLVLKSKGAGEVKISGCSIEIDTAEGIKDGGGDEFLLFSEDTAPVNYLQIANANTAVGPTLSSQGSDANVDLNIDPKGTGALNLGSADATVVVASTMTVLDEIQHTGDTDNKIVYGTDTQDYQTGGSSRLDISDSGVRLGGANARVTTILDEDNMSSDSATSLATQQSIKAYVDSTSAAKSNLAFTTGGATVAGGLTRHIGPAYLDTAANINKVRISLPYAGTIKNMYVISGAAPISTETFVYTAFTSSGQSLTVTLTGAANTGNDTSNSFSVSAGDFLTIELVTSASATTTTHQIMVEYTPT